MKMIRGTIGLVLSRPPAYSETFFLVLIKALRQSGFEVVLFVDQYDGCYKLTRQFAAPGKNIRKLIFSVVQCLVTRPDRVVSFFLLERRSGRSLSDCLLNFTGGVHILNTGKLDWLHFGFAAVAVGKENLAGAIRSRMAVSIRGYDISRFPLKHPGIFSLLWKKVDKVHTISEALLLKALKTGMTSAVKAELIPPSIEYTKWSDAAARVNAANLNAPVRILTVARLHWSKGIEYVLEALAILKSRSVLFEYNVVGGGRDLARYLLAARQFGISDMVHFHGKTDHEQLLDYFKRSDLYIQYSVQEGFCNSVLEAQATGISCIVSDAEGLPENVLDKVTGWVVPARNPEALASKIIEVLNMTEEVRETVRKNAMSRVRKQFNTDKLAESFTNFYLS
jgi:colanic acid/amylovoran biosynthesis glycosyltransferase